jgi:6-phospho-3-hexuloisomerase
MKFKKLNDDVCNEIKFVLSKIDEKEIENFIELILKTKTNRVFVIGVGRVMLMLQAFAKRLKHLGFESYVVGETTVPGIKDGDLLIAASGSGETLTTFNVVKLAKKNKANIALITSSINSTIEKLSDFTVRIPCATKLHLPGEFPSKQPMTNLFEQSLLIFCDCVSIIIQNKLNISEEDLWKVHANLE